MNGASGWVVSLNIEIRNWVKHPKHPKQSSSAKEVEEEEGENCIKCITRSSLEIRKHNILVVSNDINSGESFNLSTLADFQFQFSHCFLNPTNYCPACPEFIFSILNQNPLWYSHSCFCQKIFDYESNACVFEHRQKEEKHETKKCT